MKKTLFLSITILICAIFLIMACSKETTQVSNSGDAILKVGSVQIAKSEDNNDIANRSSAKNSGSANRNQATDTYVIALENKQLVEVNFSEESSSTDAQSNLKASTGNKATSKTEENELGKDIKYKLAVYDESGSFVTEKDYAYGNESTTSGIALQANKTYTFVAYSVNSKTDLPTISNASNIDDAILKAVNADLMYYTKTIAVKAGENKLGVVMKHLFSQITTTLDMDKSVTGSITNIGSSILKPTHSSADVRLKEGEDQINYKGINPDGAGIIFPSLGNGLRTVESEPTILIHEGTSTGTVNIGSVTIDGETKKDLLIKDIKVTPGHKYNLKLTFKTCTQDVTSEAMNWKYERKEKIIDGKKKIGIELENGTFIENNQYLNKTFSAPQSNYGFVFDITNLDNAFNMEVNGQFIFGNKKEDQIQFQTNPSLGTVRNIQFVDASEHGTSAVPEVWDIFGSESSPSISILISKTGEVQILASKTSRGKLVQMRLKNGLKFNKVLWNESGNNIVKVSQKIDGKTIVVGKGRGTKKVSCTP